MQKCTMKLTTYCKTYFCCILISQLWDVEITLHYKLAFSQCSKSMYEAFDGLQVKFVEM